MPSLTNVTFPQEKEELLRNAVKHFGYENLNQFFRACGHVIIAHYKRDDQLISPLRFVAQKSGK
jgi:hypothetical protein